MYDIHTLRHMSYVYLQIFLTRQGNTSSIEAIFLYSVCGRVVQGAKHKAKRLVLQCINGTSSNPVEGRTKICQQHVGVGTTCSPLSTRVHLRFLVRVNVVQLQSLVVCAVLCQLLSMSLFCEPLHCLFFLRFLITLYTS